MNIRTLITSNDLAALKKALKEDSSLANAELPYDEENTAMAHPLHRIADDVYSKRLTDEQAVEIAKVFLEHGAKVNGNKFITNRDTPLVAAASLLAEKLGILYVDQGADIHHPGCHGGTALHWAAWSGMDKLVERILIEKPAINQLCTEFLSTPLLWGVHGSRFAAKDPKANHANCVRLLLNAGADPTIPNREGNLPISFLQEGDLEMRKVLESGIRN